MGDAIDFSARQPSYQVTVMPRPTLLIPPHNELHRQCINCRHWLDQYEKRLVLTNMGPVPLEQLMAQAVNKQLLDSAFTGAPCTVLPKYELTPEYHWCGSFKDRNPRD